MPSGFKALAGVLLLTACGNLSNEDIAFVEALPRHDNGKLYKHQLREQLRETS